MGVMQLAAKTLTGKTIQLKGLSPRHTIYEIKEEIQQAEGLPPDQCRLVWCGKSR